MTNNIELSSIESDVMRQLQNLSEQDLQRRIIEPLMRSVGFENVKDHSGRNEKGKDIIATLKGPLGEIELIAIQIKKAKINANISSGNSITKILDQIEQALDEPTVDPVTGTRRRPSRCYFITPYPISAEAINSRYKRYTELSQRGMMLVDGTKLYDLVITNIPDVFSSLNLELHYRIETIRRCNIIEESAKAFRIQDALHLENIYIELMIDYGAQNTPLAQNGGPDRAQQTVYINEPSNWQILKPLLMGFSRLADCCRYPARANKIHEAIKKDHKLKTAVERARQSKKISAQGEATDDDIQNPKRWVEIDIEPILESINSGHIERTNTLQKILRDPEAAPSALTAAFKSSQRWDASVRRLLSNVHIKKKWPELSFAIEAGMESAKWHKLTRDQLLKIGMPIVIVGGPGCGKTTLLRKLAIVINSSFKPSAIFIRLSKVEDLTKSGLALHCINQLRDSKFPLEKNYNENIFFQDVSRGRFVLLMDGLDETGQNIGVAVNTIREIGGLEPPFPLLITCRNTIRHNITDALSIKILPFSDEQLEHFIGNWFTSEPSSKAELLQWIGKNTQMKEQARVPLIITLLCSLYEADAELPETEVDLYERRLELLIGHGERAKGIQPLSRKIQTAYTHYLMVMAISLHIDGKRIVEKERFLEVLRKYKILSHFATHEDALNDLIMRGLVEVEPDGLSLGHLTYQEYLAARWISKENDIKIVCKYMTNEWWRKTLNFYAAIRKDVSGLINHLLLCDLDGGSFERIKELIGFAPLTPISTIISLNKARHKKIFARSGA